MDLYHKSTDRQRYLPYSASHPKCYLKSISFVMARRILKKIVEIVIQKALRIPQTELRQPKTIENNNNSIFVSTLKIFDLVKSSVNTLVEGSRYTSNILRKESGYSQVESGYMGGIFGSLNMKNLRQKDI